MKNIKVMLRSPLNIALLIVLGWFILAFMIIPSFDLLKTVFFFDGQFSARAFERLFASDIAMKSLWNSLLLAVILSVTVNLVGVFIVLVTRYFDIKGGRILWLGYASSLIYSGIVLVSGYKFVYGSNGLITKLAQWIYPDLNVNWFSGMFAVVFVMTFATTGNHILFLTNSISKVDFQTIEAAKMMGASSWKVLWKVVLPTLKPMLFAITLLTFLGGLGAMVAPLILGGREFQTISPMILTFAQTPGSRDLAATLAIFLGIMTLLLVAGLNRLEKGGQYFSVSKVPAILQKQKIENPIANVIVHALAYLLFLIYMIPPVLIVIFSFTNANAIQTGNITLADFTLKNYANVLTSSSGYMPFLTSVGYGLLTSAIVVGLMLFGARIVARYRNPLTAALEYLLHIPWVLPSILIALGLILAYSEPNIVVGGVVLTGTTLLLLLAYVTVKIPFTFRLLKASYMGVPSNLEEASSMLGAGQFYTFRRVLLPIVAPTAFAIGALDFNDLLSEYNVAAFLAHPVLQPLGIVIKNATTAETISDSTALIFVYATLLMVVATVVMYLAYGRSAKTPA